MVQRNINIKSNSKRLRFEKRFSFQPLNLQRTHKIKHLQRTHKIKHPISSKGTCSLQHESCVDKLDGSKHAKRKDRMSAALEDSQSSGSGLRCGWRIVFCEVNVNIIYIFFYYLYNMYIYIILCIYNIYIYVVWFSKSPTIFHSIFQTKTNTSRFYNKTTTTRSPKNLQRPQCGKTLVASGLR